MQLQPTIKTPELVFGLVGPVGVDMTQVENALKTSLMSVGYRVEPIKITEIMYALKVDEESNGTDFISSIKQKIAYANKICAETSHADTLALLSITKIQEIRKTITGDISVAAEGVAYIIRQFKRKEELETMRKIYGRKFVTISVYTGEADRIANIANKQKQSTVRQYKDGELESEILELMVRDNKEIKDFGQQVADIFHLGDLFVGGYDSKSNVTIDRFIHAFFGSNNISPSKDEYGMYIAKAASLRSVDPSRQVGAAIFRNQGELISMGCNEVPKPSGGTYWDDDDGDKHREVEKGFDANQMRRKQIVFDLIKRMRENNLLSDQFKGKTDEQVANDIISMEKIDESQIMDIIEFGRMIHAELGAITDAARLGLSTGEATLYCTTFPCHMCAKHIVSSGIKRVVFLEPYPKSYARELHDDSISFDVRDSSGRVIFEPFIGISPRRYRDIFEKGSRKDGNGLIQDWYFKDPQPMIEDRGPAYLETEAEACVHFGEILRESDMASD